MLSNSVSELCCCSLVMIITVSLLCDISIYKTVRGLTVVKDIELQKSLFNNYRIIAKFHQMLQTNEHLVAIPRGKIVTSL